MTGSATPLEAQTTWQSWTSTTRERADPVAKPRRRTFAAEKKWALLAECEAADREGRGALLRRKAIYTSHISEWHKQRDRGR